MKNKNKNLRSTSRQIVESISTQEKLKRIQQTLVFVISTIQPTTPRSKLKKKPKANFDLMARN